MKKLLLPLLFITAAASAQKLPDTTIVKLTPSQIIAISAKIDSMQMLLQNTSNLPANQVAAFNQRLNVVFGVMFMQIQKQVVNKEKPKTGKP